MSKSEVENSWMIYSKYAIPFMLSKVLMFQFVTFLTNHVLITWLQVFNKEEHSLVVWGKDVKMWDTVITFKGLELVQEPEIHDMKQPYRGRLSTWMDGRYTCMQQRVMLQLWWLINTFLVCQNSHMPKRQVTGKWAALNWHYVNVGHFCA